MGRVAFVFPGQGSQSVGMGRAIAAASPAAAAVFAEADAVLGERLSRLAWEGPAEELNLTVNAQPAILAASIAALIALRECWTHRAATLGAVTVEPAVVAGHSMGQYSAMVAAGSISLADGLRLVRERGRQMQASGAGRVGAMAAIIGLDDALLPDLVERAAAIGVFGVANRNAPRQVVVSGERSAVEAGIEIARDLGARRIVLLPVSVAAHSPLMAEAATAMAEVIRDVPFADPRPPLVANADGHLIVDAAGARAELVDHLTAGVDWTTAVRGMARTGVDVFLEVGPGRVLTGLIKRIEPEALAIASNDPDAAGGLAAAAIELDPATFATQLGN
jgi:[acyl-carrier-protein] S-malonyltransferase